MEYFLQNDDLIMVGQPRTNSRNSLKSSIKSGKSYPEKIKSIAMMKSEGVNTERVTTVPQVMSVNYQPPPQLKRTEESTIPIVNEQEKEYD